MSIDTFTLPSHSFLTVILITKHVKVTLQCKPIADADMRFNQWVWLPVQIVPGSLFFEIPAMLLLRDAYIHSPLKSSATTRPSWAVSV